MSKKTKIEVDALSTILDVVEKISAIENSLCLSGISMIPSSQFYDEGRYNFISDINDRSIVHLLPTSQSPFIFYRGQSSFHEPCVSALYRKDNNGISPSEYDIAGNRIKICEFLNLLYTHPVFCEVGQNIQVNPIALAQHYGLATEYLDVTNSKWVAAFFASTRYDNVTDTYYPVGRDYKDGYGVMYIANLSDNMLKDFYDKNGVIGYQYFARPTKQSSFGFKMNPGEDFNEMPFFEKHFFRHEIEASKIVYEMSYKQNRFIPKDTLSKLAKCISDSSEVTRDAVILCLQNFYRDKSSEFLDDVCRALGWIIRENNTPIARFSNEEIEADWNDWNKYGRADLNSRLLPIRPVTSIKLTE